jgi:hypothetical protein
MFSGGYWGKHDEIDMMTRSMLQIMQEFAVMVRVPASVADGRAAPGLAASPDEALQSGPAMRILVGDVAPKDAYVAVQYGGRWFWIADNDIQSSC